MWQTFPGNIVSTCKSGKEFQVSSSSNSIACLHVQALGLLESFLLGEVYICDRVLVLYPEENRDVLSLALPSV